MYVDLKTSRLFLLISWLYEIEFLFVNIYVNGSRSRKLKSYLLQPGSLISLFLSLFLPSINEMFEIVYQELIVDLSLDTNISNNL